MQSWKVWLRAWPELTRNVYDHSNKTVTVAAEDSDSAAQLALTQNTGRLVSWTYNDSTVLRQYTKVRVMRVTCLGDIKPLTADLDEVPDAPPYEEFLKEVKRKRMAAEKAKARAQRVLSRTKLAKKDDDDV